MDNMRQDIKVFVAYYAALKGVFSANARSRLVQAEQKNSQAAGLRRTVNIQTTHIM